MEDLTIPNKMANLPTDSINRKNKVDMIKVAVMMKPSVHVV